MKSIDYAGYLAHAAGLTHAKRVSVALALIGTMMEQCRRPYISMSFGKDSIVLAHLVLTNYPETTVIYVNCGAFDEWPDTPRVKQAFLKAVSCNLIEITGPSIIEYYERAGYAYIQDEQTGDASRVQAEYGASLERAIVAKARELECDGVFLGLRREESYNRWRLFKMRGPLYYAKTHRMWTCCPLEKWIGRDIWAYLLRHHLPWNELYDLHPRGRERARNGAMIGTRSARYGRLVFLKQMYPDWWNRFVQKFPEIARQI